MNPGETSKSPVNACVCAACAYPKNRLRLQQHTTTSLCTASLLTTFNIIIFFPSLFHSPTTHYLQGRAAMLWYQVIKCIWWPLRLLFLLVLKIDHTNPTHSDTHKNMQQQHQQNQLIVADKMMTLCSIMHRVATTCCINYSVFILYRCTHWCDVLYIINLRHIYGGFHSH